MYYFDYDTISCVRRASSLFFKGVFSVDMQSPMVSINRDVSIIRGPALSPDAPSYLKNSTPNLKPPRCPSPGVFASGSENRHPNISGSPNVSGSPALPRFKSPCDPGPNPRPATRRTGRFSSPSASPLPSGPSRFASPVGLCTPGGGESRPIRRRASTGNCGSPAVSERIGQLENSTTIQKLKKQLETTQQEHTETVRR